MLEEHGRQALRWTTNESRAGRAKRLRLQIVSYTMRYVIALLQTVPSSYLHHINDDRCPDRTYSLLSSARYTFSPDRIGLKACVLLFVSLGWSRFQTSLSLFVLQQPSFRQRSAPRARAVHDASSRNVEAKRRPHVLRLALQAVRELHY